MLNKHQVRSADPIAAPCMLMRLNGNKWSVTCYAMLVLADGRVFKGPSLGFETSDGHAERTCVKKLCDVSGIQYIGTPPARIRELLTAQGTGFRYLYVDFEPCTECDPWLEALIGSQVPVYYLEEFPYQEIKGPEFKKTYTKFQQAFFGNPENLKDYREEATRLSALVEAQVFFAVPVARDLAAIQYNAKGEETLIGNILARGGGAEAVSAALLNDLLPLLADPRRCAEEVTITYLNTSSDTRTVKVNRISAAVMQRLITTNQSLQQYAGRYVIPPFG